MNRSVAQRLRLSELLHYVGPSVRIAHVGALYSGPGKIAAGVNTSGSYSCCQSPSSDCVAVSWRRYSPSGSCVVGGVGGVGCGEACPAQHGELTSRKDQPG